MLLRNKILSYLLIFLLVVSPITVHAGLFDSIGDFFSDVGDSIESVADSASDVVDNPLNVISPAVAINQIAAESSTTIPSTIVETNIALFDALGISDEITSALGKAFGIAGIALTAAAVLTAVGVPGADGLIAGAGALPVGVSVPFGGPILAVVPCANAAILIYFYDYRTKIPQIITFQAGFSRAYQFGAFLPGNYILGTYTTGAGVCVVPVGPIPVPVPTFGAINFIPGAGTSLIPSFGL